MSTIFIDESGYTGEDLMNSDQPIFTLATLCLPESDCQGLKERFFKKVKSPELKHKRLVENRRQELIIHFLKELSKTPDLVKLHITYKRYALVSKLVQYIVAPGAEKAGIDMRINGRGIGLTYFMYRMLPELAGKEFFDDMLRRFQQMMIDKDHQSYHLFFDPLFDERYPQVSDTEQQRMIDYLLWHIKIGCTSVGYDLIDPLEATAQSLGIAHSRPLDIAFANTLEIMQKWRKDVNDEIILFHDASSSMAEVFPLWQTFVHPHPPPILWQFNTGNPSSPMGVSETYLLNSKNWVGLQLADILAGAAAWWINWGENGAKSDDAYGVQLNTIMPTFPNWALRPPTNTTLEDFKELGMTEEEARVQDQYIEKLTAFHRIRAYGYFYPVDFNK